MSAALPRRLHVERARTVLEDIARGTKPADQLLEALFRAHKEMGKRDRASVSTLVYGVLRDVGRLQVLAGASAADWLARHLADAGHAAEAIVALGLPMPAVAATVSAAAACNLPDDLHARLVRQLGGTEAIALAAALNEAAPTDLRVNTLKASCTEVLAALGAQGIAAVPTPYSPLGLRLAQRLSKQSPLLRDGEIEPQDEGSQLLAAFAAVAAGETVIDWCAGAGGKSLALAAAMQNRGRVIACDISASRLARLPPRAARAGADIIETVVHGTAAALPAADLVLVDAPCSGTGTLRRNPELRLKTVDYAALAALQERILAEAAVCVRPGGRLVYATCSLLREENETVVERFLVAHPRFRVRQWVDLPQPLQNLVSEQGMLRLWPHLHGTDGFFAQSLVRT